MECKCVECVNYSGDLRTGKCSLKNYTVIANSTCKDSKKKSNNKDSFGTENEQLNKIKKILGLD